MTGTVLGLLPGLVLMSVMGDRILKILSDPSLGDVGILLLCVAGLIGLALGIEIAMVATHHLFRLFLILGTSPLVFRFWRARDEAKAAAD